MATNKGFIRDWRDNILLPITRGELVLDSQGIIALNSEEFLANKDENGLPGLITAAERAMLSGGGSGGGISDIYKKLEYINTGLLINGGPVKFYNTDNVQTTINLTSTTDDSRISVLANGNVVYFSLASIDTDETKVENTILKNITVDKYGRVTSVSGSALTNAEIPQELDGKKISNSTFTTCTTAVEAIVNDPKAIVNKAYVDQAIQGITGLATGALKFGGPLSSANEADLRLKNSAYVNHYFKVTKTFTLTADQLYSETESLISTQVHPGDTLIIHSTEAGQKFVYVPSGNDFTTITIQEEGQAAAVDGQMGPIGFQFASVFNVTNIGGNFASINLPKADASTNGYLSATDFNKFNSYADSLAVTYSQTLAQSVLGSYEIGKITIGGNETVIYGKNSITKLTVNNGVSDVYNPILKFEETDESAKDITFKGGAGIQVRRVVDQDALEFLANISIQAASSKYLTSNGHQIGVVIGSIGTDENPAAINDGLTDYAEFATFKASTLTILNSTLTFSPITDSLKDTTKDLYYGSADLKTAITVTI